MNWENSKVNGKKKKKEEKVKHISNKNQSYVATLDTGHKAYTCPEWIA